MSVSSEIIREIASKEDVDTTELEPLHDVMDPEALDSLYRDSSNAPTVRFNYSGYCVSIYNTDAIEVGKPNANLE